MAQDRKDLTTRKGPGRSIEPFSTFRSDLNRVFDSFLDRGFDAFPEMRLGTWTSDVVPSMDVRETATDVVVEAELPGIDEKDISLTLNNGILTLKGEKKSKREEKNEDYQLMERSYGSFQRSLQLGNMIDPDKVDATFDKGVLKITLAKRPEAVASEKKIAINTNS